MDIEDLVNVAKVLRRLKKEPQSKTPAKTVKSKSPVIKGQKAKAAAKSKSPVRKVPAKSKSPAPPLKKAKSKSPVKKVLKKVSNPGKGKELVLYKRGLAMYRHTLEQIVQKGQAAKTVLKFIAPIVGVKVVEHVYHNPQLLKDLQHAAVDYLQSSLASFLPRSPPPVIDYDKEHYEAVKKWARDELVTFGQLYGRTLVQGLKTAAAVGTLSVAWIPRGDVF